MSPMPTDCPTPARNAQPTGDATGDSARPQTPARSIALVGMMGVGKTTIGRRLAPRLGLEFRDADEEIEQAAGMSVSELFARHGEESFRRGEAQVVKRLLEGPPIVLATGGGALTNAETRALVAERALSVWLRADVDTLVRRATKRATRPLLQTGDPRAVIERLLAERTPYYAAADIVVDSGGGPHGETVEAIVEAIEAHDKEAHETSDGLGAPRNSGETQP